MYVCMYVCVCMYTGDHDLDAVFTRLIYRQIPRERQVFFFKKKTFFVIHFSPIFFLFCKDSYEAYLPLNFA